VDTLTAYELMFIINPGFDEENVNATIEKYKNLIVEQGGTVSEVNPWGKRRLAYEIDKHRDGYYVLFNFEGDSKVVDELQRIMKISDDTIRYLLISKDEK
jgi:small subunit ribosomal protein S6